MKNRIFDNLIKNIHVFSRDGRWICYHKGTNKIIELDENEAKLLISAQESDSNKLSNKICSVLNELYNIVGDGECVSLSLQPINTFYLKFNNICNLTCKYCRISQCDTEKNNVLNEKVAVQAVKVMKALGAKGVGIHGGEPLLHKKTLKNIISAIRKTDCKFLIGITCNGTLVDEEIASFFAVNNVLVSIELDGQKKIHDEFKCYNNGNSSFDDALRGAKLLERYGVLVAIESTVSGLNGYDSKGYKQLSEMFPNTPIVVARIKNSDINKQEYVSHGKKLLGFLQEELKSIGDNNIFNDAIAGMINLLNHPCTSKYMCNCLLDKVSVDIDGNVYICPKVESKNSIIGNVMDSDFVNYFSKNRERASHSFSADKVSFTWYSNLVEHCIDAMYSNNSGVLKLQDDKYLERFFEDLIYLSVNLSSTSFIERWQNLGF